MSLIYGHDRQGAAFTGPQYRPAAAVLQHDKPTELARFTHAAGSSLQLITPAEYPAYYRLMSEWLDTGESVLLF